MLKLTQIDRREAFRYAGMHGEPTPQLTALADECERILLSEIRPAYVYRVFPLKRTFFGIHCEGSSAVLSGADIETHLRRCTHAAVFCATLSFGADRAIRAAQAKDVAMAHLMDAMASAAVEQFCDMAEKEILSLPQLRHFFTTWRYSPGYGDFPIAAQIDLLGAIDAARRIGVCVNESGIMTPRKSVTAIVGLADTPLQRQRRGCAVCNLSETCPYRAKGGHCK